MIIFKSEKTAYNPTKKKNVPVWKINTNTLTVTHFNGDTNKEENKYYHSDSVKYHLSFSSSRHPNRLKKLVNDGKIIEYLDDLENKVEQAIKRQVDKWKSSDTEYQIAVQKGDIQTAVGLENCLVYMAREIIFDCMVYI